ncbi:PQQ-dependent sugar dehydrogenase [Glaciibacter sp. 2TAF33]|uniref:PQQ-dependent sugar dehydrogenase n=1 Tax=Glaciibacter sp. 2TAF33 TaxID=3233015 RepID=UPI003F908370
MRQKSTLAAAGNGVQRMRRRGVLALGALAATTALALTACTAGPPRPPTSTSTPARPVPSETAPPTGVLLPVHPVGDPVVIASQLDVPWSIVRIPAGGTLISERDAGEIVELLPDGGLREAGTVPGVEPGGEGGLLGLAYRAAADDTAADHGTDSGADSGSHSGSGTAASAGWIYAYFTAADDNRIVRMPLTGAAGSYGLGTPELILDGIPKAGNHNGGRLGFGPDGLLYATAGDAGNGANAQDRNSLGGKILRMTPTGGVPTDNPFGTLVYSYGHRNPQGIAWDSHGQLWASEFGQNTWDELNRITPGSNYGWPVVEGAAGNPSYVDPVQQWRTDVASPSGIAIVNDTVFMASLRGERLWRIVLSTGEAGDWFVHSFGRLRDVVSGPDGTLWFVSNNTDGRGNPGDGDDRLYQVQVAP